MTARRRLSPTWVWLLLVLALALRLAAPPGWMPVADSGGIRVALCTDSGIKTVRLDTGEPAKSGAERRDPCPFGLAGGKAITGPPAPELTQAPAMLAALHLPMLSAARLTVQRALRPPARGPPLSA